MITTTSKEQILVLNYNPISGSIALVGDLYACRNYAARYYKQSPNSCFDSNLASATSLPMKDAPVKLYYAGEFYNNKLTLALQPETNLVLIVDDLLERVTNTVMLINSKDIRYEVLSAIDSDGLTRAQKELQAGDWFMFRELERMFLADHPEHKRRELLRAQVDLVNEVNEHFKDESETYTHKELSIEELTAMPSSEVIAVQETIK